MWTAAMVSSVSNTAADAKLFIPRSMGGERCAVAIMFVLLLSMKHAAAAPATAMLLTFESLLSSYV